MIWIRTGTVWGPASPQPVLEEKGLERLIAENPEFLPLAGSPRLFVLGRQVTLGTGAADIVAVESTGRPVIIEVKLARNSEERRTIVAQTLDYASSLHGYSIKELEDGPLFWHLANKGGSIIEAVQSQDKEVDKESFESSMEGYLERGAFRLVFAFDEPPRRALERLVSYLDAITIDELTIDLVALRLRRYDINGVEVASPKRIIPGVREYQLKASSKRARSQRSEAIESEGADDFKRYLEGVSDAEREGYEPLIAWAEEIASLPNVHILSRTYKTGNASLIPKIRADDTRLVLIWKAGKRPSMELRWEALERLAPNSIEAIEAAIVTERLESYSTTIHEFTSEVLEALTAAYKEATGYQDEQP